MAITYESLLNPGGGGVFVGKYKHENNFKNIKKQCRNATANGLKIKNIQNFVNSQDITENGFWKINIKHLAIKCFKNQNTWKIYCTNSATKLYYYIF